MDASKEPSTTVEITLNECHSEKSNDAGLDEVLSKRQQKRLAKRLKWLNEKPLRRLKEKEKRKLKRKQAAESGQTLGPSRKCLKASKMAESPCKLKICFDLSLAHLMTPDELSKTLKQLNRCYSINRRADAPLQLYITGYSDDIKQDLDRTGCLNWDVNFSQQSHCEMFDKNDIIYLSSDSDNVLEDVDLDKVYIIGALVDHNRLKNVCHEKASEEGVGHASLPLDKYFKFQTRKVLTIDQVYSLFLRLTEGSSWIDAIEQTVPKRKGIQLKSDASDIDGLSKPEDQTCEQPLEETVLYMENNTVKLEK